MSRRTRIRKNVSHSGVLPNEVCETGGARPTCLQTVREKMGQNGGLIFCDGRVAFRQVPAGGAESSHIHVRAAALATARRRERRFQGSADQSGGCLALWSQFESGAGAQARAQVSGNVRSDSRMSRILGVKKQTMRYDEERFRRGRLRGFDNVCCKLQTRRPEKKATNRTAKWKSYIPYKTPLIRTVKHGKKQLTPPRGLQSEAACLPLSRSGGVVEWWSGGVVE